MNEYVCTFAQPTDYVPCFRLLQVETDTLFAGVDSGSADTGMMAPLSTQQLADIDAALELLLGCFEPPAESIYAQEPPASMNPGVPAQAALEGGIS